MKILIIDGSEKRDINARGGLNKSLVNYWLKKLRYNHEVIITEVSEGYNIQEERNKFINSDLVILQFPMYWFSLPGLTKRYIDDVFYSNQFYEHTKSYGKGGLIRAKYILSSTCNAPMDEFSNNERFFQGYSIDEIYLPIHKSFEYIGMTKVNSISAHSVLTKPDIDKYKDQIDEVVKQI